MKAKLLAVERRTSVSGLLVQTLTRLVEQADVYKRAERRYLKRLDRGLDLGTRGVLDSSRDALHERR
jgi:hypothetical protein